MLFAILCDDKPGSLETRMSVRDRHVEHLTGLGDRLKFAGPFLGDDGKPCGSLVMVEADDLAAAKAIAEKDPYAEAGLFSSVTVRPWKWSIKNPDAG